MTQDNFFYTEYNAQTNEETVRPMTQDEIDQYLAQTQLELQKEAEAAAAREAKRLTKIAALTRIGLSEEEVESLF